MKMFLKVLAILECMGLPVVILIVIIICNTRPGEVYIPYGKWANKEIDLYLDFNPENGGENHDMEYYYGVYKGEDIYIYTPFSPSSENFFYIYAKGFHWEESQETAVDNKLLYMSGSYVLKKGKLYFYLDLSSEERLGYKTIVFELIEAYELPESSSVSE